MKNEFKVVGSSVIIHIHNKSHGKLLFALVDKDDLEKLEQFKGSIFSERSEF